MTLHLKRIVIMKISELKKSLTEVRCNYYRELQGFRDIEIKSSFFLVLNFLLIIEFLDIKNGHLSGLLIFIIMLIVFYPFYKVYKLRLVMIPHKELNLKKDDKQQYEHYNDLNDVFDKLGKMKGIKYYEELYNRYKQCYYSNKICIRHKTKWFKSIFNNTIVLVVFIFFVKILFFF